MSRPFEGGGYSLELPDNDEVRETFRVEIATLDAAANERGNVYILDYGSRVVQHSTTTTKFCVDYTFMVPASRLPELAADLKALSQRQHHQWRFS